MVNLRTFIIIYHYRSLSSIYFPSIAICLIRMHHSEEEYISNWISVFGKINTNHIDIPFFFIAFFSGLDIYGCRYLSPIRTASFHWACSLLHFTAFFHALLSAVTLIYSCIVWVFPGLKILDYGHKTFLMILCLHVHYDVCSMYVRAARNARRCLRSSSWEYLCPW